MSFYFTIFYLIIALIANNSHSALQRGSPWPMRGRNSQHGANSPFFGPNISNSFVDWIYKDTALYSSPVIDVDNNIYIGFDSGIFRKLSNDGVPSIFYLADNAIRSTPAIDNFGNVYFGCSDGKIYAIGSELDLIWTYKTLASVLSSPTLNSRSRLYVGSQDGSLYSLDTKNGSLRWQFTAGYSSDSAISSSPTLGVNESLVFFGSENSNFYCLNANNGTMQWKFIGPGPSGAIKASSIYSDVYNIVVFAAIDGYLYAVGANSGQLIWKYDTEEALMATPCFSKYDDYVIIGTGAGSLLAFFSNNGSLFWNTSFDAPIYSSPVIDAIGMIYIGCAHLLYSINSDDGSIEWTVYIDGIISTAALAIGASGNLLVISTNADKKEGYLTSIGIGNSGFVNNVCQKGSVINATYLPTDRNVQCMQYCPAGYGSSIGGTLLCSLCNVGTYNDGRSISCTRCPGNAEDSPSGSTSIDDCVVTAAGYPATSSYPNGAAWPQYHRNQYGLNQSPFFGSLTNEVSWTYNSTSTISSSPTIGPGGIIYMAIDDGRVVSFSKEGELLWTYQTGDRITRSSPTLGINGMIYIGVGDSLYALSQLGAFLWSMPTGGPIWGSPSLGLNNTVYITSWDSTLYAVDGYTGSIIWTIRSGAQMSSTPAVGRDGTVYVTTFDMILYAISTTGRVLWKFSEARSAIISSPSILPNGNIIFGCEDSRVYAVSIFGTLIWSFRTRGKIDSSPAISNDGVIYIGAYNAGLYAISSDGAKLWFRQISGGITSSSAAIGADGLIYVGCKDGNMRAYNSSGDVVWTLQTSAEIASSPAITDDGRIIFGSNDGVIYSVGVAGERSQCPGGSYISSNYTSTAVDVCEPCSEGYYSSPPRTSICYPCEKGYFADEIGLSRCKKCPFPYTNYDSAATSCDGFRIGLSLNYLLLVLFSFVFVYICSIFLAKGEWLLAFVLTVIPVVDFLTDIAFLLSSDFYNAQLFYVCVTFLLISNLVFAFELFHKRVYPMSIGSGYMHRFLWLGIKSYSPTVNGALLPVAFDDYDSIPKIVVLIISWIACVLLQFCSFLALFVWLAMLLPLLFVWFCIGALLFQMKVIAIGPLWNAWVRTWTGGRDFDADPGALDLGMLHKSMFAEFLFESLPQLTIQAVNARLLGELNTISLVSIILSLCMAVNGLYRFGYWKFYMHLHFSEIPLGMFANKILVGSAGNMSMSMSMSRSPSKNTSASNSIIKIDLTRDDEDEEDAENVATCSIMHSTVASSAVSSFDITTGKIEGVVSTDGQDSFNNDDDDSVADTSASWMALSHSLEAYASTMDLSSLYKLLNLMKQVDIGSPEDLERLIATSVNRKDANNAEISNRNNIRNSNGSNSDRDRNTSMGSNSDNDNDTQEIALQIKAALLEADRDVFLANAYPINRQHK